jgi:hypothetical protein
MNWSEGVIARAIALQTLARKCTVLVDNCNWTGYECDVLAVTNDLRIIDVEVKISRADLKADAKKDKWWHRLGWRKIEGPERARLHPPKVWKHYYALPQEIWKPELLDCLPSPASGVILMREQRNSATPVVAEVVRRATPAKDAYRLTAEQVMDISRLANLRMWEAYKRAEAAQAEASDFYHGRRQTLVAFQTKEAA